VLFRPITVVVPDRQLIMENMLMAEGFVQAKMLAKKFASLYYLLEDLLSPAKYAVYPFHPPSHPELSILGCAHACACTCGRA
jgi:Hydrolytic ATP binding site of dynein motor region